MPPVEKSATASWDAQNLRLITFPAEPQFAAEQNWWFELTGSERESRTDKARVRQDEGPCDGTTLSLVIDPVRLHWTASPQLDQEDRPPSIGPFDSRKPWFQGLMQRWLAMSPPVKRIAFSGTLLQRVSDRASGFEVLDRYVRAPRYPSNATDLLFRINLPVDIAFRGDGVLKINQLTTWSVTTFKIFHTQIGPSIPPRPTETSEFHAFTLEFDINTALEVDCSTFTAEELIAAFDILVAETGKIAERGIRNHAND